MERIATSWSLLLSLSLSFCSVSLAAESSEQLSDFQEFEKIVETVDAANVNELVDALENPLFREKAKATLLKIGAPATQRLLEKLEDEELQNRKVLVELLGKLGSAGKQSWPILLQKCTTKDRELSIQITRSLILNGADVVPTLIQGLEDPSTEIRSNSARLLSELGPLADQAIPALRTRLRTRGESSSVRFWTMIALTKMGPAAEAALPELLKALSTVEKNERYLPAQALGSIGPPARAAIPQLVQMLKDRETVRNADAATEALIQMGVDAVPSVLEMLKLTGRDRRLPDTASFMLVSIGKPAVPYLLRLLEHPDELVVERAALILLQIGEPGVADMMELMKTSSNTDVQFTLAQILARIPSASGMAVPGLIVGLQNPDPVQRMAAAQALAETGPPAISAFPYLIRALQVDAKAMAQRQGENFPTNYVNAIGSALMAGGEAAILPLHQAMLHDHELVRTVAIQVMANLGQQYRTIVIPRMVGSLMMDNKRLKEGALATLSGIEPGRFTLARLGPKAIPGLVIAVTEGTPHLRLKAAQAMAMLGEPSVAPLSEMLTSPSLEIRLVAVQSLGAMQSVAEPAIPVLIKALNVKPEMAKIPEIPAHIWEEYAQNVALALGSIGGSAVPQLITVLEGKDTDMQSAAALALSRIGRQAAPAVDALRECLKQPNLEVHMAAMAALNRIGPASLPAAAELLQLLRTKDTAFRGDPNETFLRLRYVQSTMDALGRMGKDAIPVLLPLIRDSDEDFRAHVAYALFKLKIDPKHQSLIDPALQDDLIAALSDKSLVVRIVAAKALGAQGVQAEPAIDELIQAIRASGEVIGDERFDKELITDYLPSIVSALDEIGEAAVQPLIQAAKEDNEVLQGVAAWALFRIDPDAGQLVSLGEGTIPVLINVLHSRETDFTDVAAEALMELGDPAAEALLKTIKEKRLGFFHPVFKTLARMHEHSSGFLMESLKDPDPFVRATAARALGGPKPSNADSIPISGVIESLTEALKDEHPEVKASAEHSLYWLDVRLAKQLGIKDPSLELKVDPLLPRQEDPRLQNPFAEQ